MNNLKKITLALSFSLLLSIAANANVVCEKEGRYWYPKNATAVKITKLLGVKTCNGKRFKTVVAKLGMRSNVVASMKKNTIADVLKAMNK